MENAVPAGVPARLTYPLPVRMLVANPRGFTSAPWSRERAEAALRMGGWFRVDAEFEDAKTASFAHTAQLFWDAMRSI